MRSTTVRVAAAGVIACVAMLVVALGASGATSFHTKAKIKSINPDAVSGTVSSSEEACEAKRKVNLYYGAAAAPRGDLVKIGATKTNDKGKWTIEGDFFVGHYRIVVPGTTVQVGKLEEEPTEVDDDPDDDDEDAAGKRGSCSKSTYSTDE